MSFTIDPGPAADDLVRQLPHGDGVTELVELVTSRRAVAHRVFLRSEQRHEPASRISLTDERDGLGLARLALDWRVAPQDVQAVSIGMELVVDAFADLGVAVVHHDPVVPAPTGLTGGAHHLGGARMHDDPRQGVVDADLRVHGTDNLFVCSSSTFPTGCHSNPTMTVVALAHRLAQRLAAA